MNLTWGTWTADEWHLPRVHGDEPITSQFFAPQRKSTLYARGWIRCTIITKNMYHFWSTLTKKCYPQKYDCLKWYILVLLRKSKAKGNNGLPSMETSPRDLVFAPYTRGWTHFLITSGLIINDLPRIHGNEFTTPQLPKYVSFLANIDQKALSAKICSAKMMHTGSVAEVQDKKTAC